MQKSERLPLKNSEANGMNDTKKREEEQKKNSNWCENTRLMWVFTARQHRTQNEKSRIYSIFSSSSFSSSSHFYCFCCNVRIDERRKKKNRKKKKRKEKKRIVFDEVEDEYDSRKKWKKWMMMMMMIFGSSSNDNNLTLNSVHDLNDVWVWVLGLLNVNQSKFMRYPSDRCCDVA